MTRRKKKSEPDENQIASGIVEQVTSDKRIEKPAKNPHAVALGRLGGLKGGKARAKALSGKRRTEIARKAVRARWNRSHP